MAKVIIKSKVIEAKLDKISEKMTQHDERLKEHVEEERQYHAQDMHLKSNKHISWQTVYNSISDDYDEKDREFIKHLAWSGPVEVPLSSIDFSNMDQWAASKPGPEGQDKVDAFAKKLADKGWWKPIVLVNQPHTDEKMQVIDGRHRLLAAKKEGMSALAYVADVGSIAKDTPYMQLHDKQKGSDS